MTDSTDNARGPERIVWDAMVWAAQQPAPRYGAAYPSYTDRGNSDAEIKCRETVARIRADLAPDPLGAVKVKPLEWERLETMPWRMRAKPMFGFEAAITDWALRAELHEQDEQHGFTLHLEGKQINTDTMQEAKAAAQADYERRIRSALEPCGPLADPHVVVEQAFMAAVWDALKSDANDLRKQKRILSAFRTALSPTGGNDE